MAREFDWKDLGIGLLSMKMPSIAKGYYGALDQQYNEEQAAKRGILADELYGQRGVDFSQQNSPNQVVIQEPQQGRGYLDQVEPGSAEEKFARFNQGLLESGDPMMQKAWAANNKQMQAQSMQSERANVENQYAPTWLNLGDKYLNPADGTVHPIKPKQKILDLENQFMDVNSGETYQKNIIDAKMRDKVGSGRGKRYAGFGKSLDTGQNVMDSIADTSTMLKDLRDGTNLWNTGISSYTKEFPMTPAMTWDQKKEVILSRLAVDKMAELKALSPTGSTGFGALSERELDVLQKQLGSLEQAQGPTEVKSQIDQILKLLEKSGNKFKKARKEEIQWHNRNLMGGDEKFLDSDPGLTTPTGVMNTLPKFSMDLDIDSLSPADAKALADDLRKQGFR